MNIEMTAIAAMLADNRRIDHFAMYADIITDEYCRQAFSAILEMREEGKSIDTVSLMMYCKNNGYNIPKKFFAELLKTPNVVTYHSFFEEIVEYRKNIEIDRTLKKLREVSDRDEVQKCVDIIVDLKQKKNVRSVISPEELASLDVTLPKDKPRFWRTGIIAIDNFISGLYEGQLIIIAGRPGKGKTTLALQIALNLDAPSLFLSGEMTAKELYLKMLVNHSGVPQWNIEHNVLDAEQAGKINQAQEYFRGKLKISVYDGYFDFLKICNLLRTHNADVMIIDYLQRIASERENSEHLRIARITNRLKDIARETRKPIVLLSQLNREIEKTKRKPQLSDLRESGSIEADADVVIFVYELNDRWQIDIAKNRKGDIGTIDTVNFDKRLSRIYDSVAYDPFTMEVAREIQNGS